MACIKHYACILVYNICITVLIIITIHSKLTMKKGDDPKFMKSTDLLVCAWQDTKRVTLISSLHANRTVNKNLRSRGSETGYRVVQKPVMAEEYNQHMGGVDCFDQRLGSYSYPHKNQKWYQAIYHRLVSTAI